jgi:hypothetical protein
MSWGRPAASQDAPRGNGDLAPDGGSLPIAMTLCDSRLIHEISSGSRPHRAEVILGNFADKIVVHLAK